MNQLPWMRAAEDSLGQWDEHTALAAAVRAAGLTRTLVCGMGGSSLVADVLAETFGARQLHVLDSTNPAAVRAAGEETDLARTAFVISSKSGNTVETLAFCTTLWRGRVPSSSSRSRRREASWTVSRARVAFARPSRIHPTSAAAIPPSRRSAWSPPH